jgi:hypothetical protein
MLPRNRFLIGGLGGLAPVILFFATVDFERYYVESTALKTFGYFFRGALLFVIGGFVAYLHESEISKFKIFEIGLGAPALLAGILTSASISNQVKNKPESSTTISYSIFSFIPEARAEPRAININNEINVSELKKFTVPSSEQVLDGFLGIPPKSIWYVIAGSHINYEDAKKQATKINSQNLILRGKPIRAEVYAPFPGNSYYGVVIGENLSKSEAQMLRNAVVSKGLPKDTYTWAYIR